LARAIGWVFVAFVAYHAALATEDAWRAGSDRSWAALVGYAAIAAAGVLVVIGAVVHAAQGARRRVR
jgi:hypothetical protein